MGKKSNLLLTFLFWPLKFPYLLWLVPNETGQSNNKSGPLNKINSAEASQGKTKAEKSLSMKQGIVYYETTMMADRSIEEYQLQRFQALLIWLCLVEAVISYEEGWHGGGSLLRFVRKLQIVSFYLGSSLN